MIAATDLSQIGELIFLSAGAGILVTLAFSLCLSGAVHAGEARREGRSAALVGWSAVTLLALAAFLGLCVLGIVFITAK